MHNSNLSASNYKFTTGDRSCKQCRDHSNISIPDMMALGPKIMLLAVLNDRGAGSGVIRSYEPHPISVKGSNSNDAR
jgi:hypothetical protein